MTDCNKVFIDTALLSVILQLAVANICGYDIMLTNDKQLRQFTDTKCITMDEL